MSETPAPNAGQFKPGQSGNPEGRPKGARNKATLACEKLLDGEAEKLTRVAIDKALAGDMAALRLCLERITPARKDAPVVFDLPPITTIGDAVAASSSLLAAVAAGDVTPDEAQRVMALLTAHKVLVETSDLEARIAALEAATNG